jgi:hypothetical protein
MLLVVTTSPSRLTLTGGVVPSLEAMVRFRIGAEAVPEELISVGTASCWSTWLSELIAFAGRIRLEAFRMPMTLASRALRLDPDFPDGSIVSAWRLRLFPRNPAFPTTFC